jgi:hypothetical protein
VSQQQLPDRQQVLEAVRVYLDTAYQDPPPAAVLARVNRLRHLAPDEFYQSSLFETDHHRPPTRYSLRLGNRFYPHMKLTIDRRPDQGGYLFRADTHDRHCCPPPASPEYRSFCALMEQNQKLAEAVERAWAEHGLPTFKAWLRDDLKHRKAQARNK